MSQSIQDYLGVPKDWKVKENVKHEILLMPTAQDIKQGKISDPKGCALYNTACRMFDVPTCAIGPRFSFIPQRDNKGRMYIARVAATNATRKAIIQFDKTGTMPIAGFRFIPLTKGNTYAGKKASNDKYLSEHPRDKKKERKTIRRRKLVTRSIPYVKAA